MRRFSQRHSLVTLSDINITPLLDLAFVLLIIFIITTPLLEQGLNLKLPIGDAIDKKQVNPKDVRTVQVGNDGLYLLGERWMTLADLSRTLVFEHRKNPRLLVYIRADKKCPYGFVASAVDALVSGGIDEFSLRINPRSH
jgi:biopolymer transport protein ExbD